MAFNVGDLIRDRYKVKQKLGSGNWGVTYLVTDLQVQSQNDAECVIKEIKPSTSLSLEENRGYFEREIKALKILGKHPQIPNFIDSFIEREYFYIVQEFIAGTLLSQKIKPSIRVTEKEAKILLLDILKIVQFIHQKKHIHRDLKPDNIIQKVNGEIVIIDFGTVKEINILNRANSGDTLSLVIGAPFYIAPERCSFPRPEEFDRHPRVDIYSLGIIGLQIITGLSPNSLHIDPYNDGARLWSDAVFVSPKMKHILNKMAHPNYKPGYRYQTVEEVIIDLQQLKPQENLPLISNHPNFWTKIKLLSIGFIGLVAGALSIKILPSLINAPPTKDYHIDFAEVCNSPIVKGEKLKNYTGKPEHITLKHPPFVWTVFRWKCVFTYRGDTHIRGIELNDYCAVTYKDSGYKYEAYFKNYLNANSWYCTNVGTKLESNELDRK